MIETVVRQGWFSRIKSAFVGILFGLLLIGGSAVLQFWNEGRTLRQQQMLDAGRAEVVAVDASSPPSSADLLAYASGEARAVGERLDPVFNQPAEGIALRRKVEMYQWKERRETREETQVGGSKVTRTTYHYDQVWSDDLIDHSGFHERSGHENPASMPFRSETWMAERVDLGALQLGPDVVAEIGGWKPMAAAIDRLPANLAVSFVPENGVLTTASGAPRIGDLRVAFERKPDGQLSLVARLRDGVLQADQRDHGSLLLVERGSHSAAALFDAAERRNAGIGWVLRGLGFVLMWVGFGLLFAPIAVFSDVLPIAGRFTRWINTLVSGVLAATISFVAIASGWLFHRPWLLGVFLLVAAGLLIALFRRTAATASAPPVPTGTGAMPPPLPPPPPS